MYYGDECMALGLTLLDRGPGDVSIDMFKPLPDANVTVSQQSPVEIFYIVRLLTSNSFVDMRAVQANFNDLLDLHGELYGLCVLKELAANAITTTTTTAPTVISIIEMVKLD